MSIRIYNDGLAGAAASETSRAADLARTTAGAGSPAVGSGVPGEDQVQISSLSEAIAATQGQRSARVQDLAAVYQSGSYKPDSTAVSNALVEHALQAGATEGSQ